jgi:tRNA-splicing ligase RtcB
MSYLLNSLGTLGGGNHFIEVDLDANSELRLTIHSGSRNFGLKIATYHLSIAEASQLTISREECRELVEKIKQTKKRQRS